MLAGDAQLLWHTGGMIWRTAIKVCRHCGAAHEYQYAEFSTQRSGRQDCLACGKEIISWYGSRRYSDFKLVKVADALDSEASVPTAPNRARITR
jgi:hypothetical protein